VNESSIHSAKNEAERDAVSVHAAVNEASINRNFIDRSLQRIEGLHFPVYKYQILEYAKGHSIDSKTVALFESLNGTMQYHDQYHLKKSLEQENSAEKQDYHISDKTRQDLQVQNVDRRQKRKDHRERPASTMKNYICNFCGKELQSGDKLKDHQEFEFK
jgi:hypothetical protein